jgi:hypothetical protein
MKNLALGILVALTAVCSPVGAVDLLGVPYLNEVSYPGSDSCMVWVYGTSTSGELAACANSGYPNRLVFDMCTPQGRNWLSLILAYNAQSKTMKVVGKGVCDIWNNTESVGYLRVNEGG